MTWEMVGMVGIIAGGVQLLGARYSHGEDCTYLRLSRASLPA